jgi:hypothetical protein
LDGRLPASRAGFVVDVAIINYLSEKVRAFAAAQCPQVKANVWFRVYTSDGKQRGIELQGSNYQNALASNIFFAANKAVEDAKARNVDEERRAEEQRSAQAAAQEKVNTAQKIQNAVRDAKAGVATVNDTPDFKEFVAPVLNFYRAKREQWGPFVQVCSAGYEYVSGTVVGRSIEGLTAVILMDIFVININATEIVSNSPFGSVCGNPDQALAPGSTMRMRLKTKFRKYDTGWQFEGLAQ